MKNNNLLIYLTALLLSMGLSSSKVDSLLSSGESSLNSYKEIELKDFVIKKPSEYSELRGKKFAAHGSHSSHQSHSSHYSHQSGS